MTGKPFLWPIFDHYGINSEYDLAAHCVETLANKPLERQLVIRRVSQLVIEPRMATGSCVPTEDNKSFIIYLSSDSLGSDHLKRPEVTSDNLFTFAHEFGHTFGFEFVGGKIRNLLPEMFINARVLDSIEQFANTFAHLWLAHAKHRRWLEKYLNDQVRLIEPKENPPPEEPPF